jgi:hypothetical protein
VGVGPMPHFGRLTLEHADGVLPPDRSFSHPLIPGAERLRRRGLIPQE